MASNRRSPVSRVGLAGGCLALGAMVLAGCSSSSGGGSPGGSTSIVASFSNITGDNIPLWIAKDQGLFKDQNLNVDLRLVESSNGFAALLAGDVKIAAVGGSEVASAAASGADVVILANESPVYPYQLWVSSDIKTVQDLKGKKVGVSKHGSSSDIGTRAALAKVGLKADSDVTIVPVGSHSARTAALVSGSIQGGLDDPPDSIKLEQNGLHPLIDLAKLKIPDANTVLVAQKGWVSSHKDAVQRFMNAYVAGLKVELSNQEKTVSAMKKYFKGDPDSALIEGAKFFAQSVAHDPPTTDPANFSVIIQYGKELNPKLADVDMSKYIDNSFVENAEKQTSGG